MDDDNRRSPRSQRYQDRFAECSVPIDLLDSFSSQDNLYKKLSPFAYNEAILDLEEQLRQEFWRLIKENLTDKQQKLVKLIAEGLTQQEVAKVLGINQSSASKNLTGSKEYMQDGTTKTYGGIKKKLKEAVEKDEKVLSILQQIADLRDDTWIKE